mgnify:CR=1 FL=1
MATSKSSVIHFACIGVAPPRMVEPKGHLLVLIQLSVYYLLLLMFTGFEKFRRGKRQSKTNQ